jgi:hypothetical protein
VPVSIPRKWPQELIRVIRSDSGVAHRLSLSARVLSTVVSQVKAKRQAKKRLRHLLNRASAAIQQSARGLCIWTKSEYYPDIIAP